MGLELLRSLLSLLQQGSEANWWGLVCPSHCRGIGVGGLLAAYLLGVLSSIFVGFAWFLLREHLFFERSRAEVPQTRAPVRTWTVSFG